MKTLHRKIIPRRPESRTYWSAFTGLWIVSAIAAGGAAASAQVTASDGDWSMPSATLTNTPQAAFMARVGDIDNLGFGWPSSFDPFSGNSTPGHGFPWTPGASDPDGTDRIMVVSSYSNNPPCGLDGYTSTTSRPANSVRPIVLQYALPPLTVTNAVIQIFVDDFQAPVWCASYQVTINGRRAPFLEAGINQLSQTGPIGKLLTVPVPSDFLNEVESGQLAFVFDDPTTGAGDGYAVDFVKLLVNAAVFQTGTISGHVYDAVSHQPLAGAQITSFGNTNTADMTGLYTLSGVPAGLAFLQASATGYLTASRTVDVIAGQTTTGMDLNLQRGPLQLFIRRATIVPSEVELRFFAFGSISYTLQYTTNLAQWYDDTNVSGAGAEATFTRPADSVGRYWRVRQN